MDKLPDWAEPYWPYGVPRKNQPKLLILLREFIGNKEYKSLAYKLDTAAGKELCNAIFCVYILEKKLVDVVMWMGGKDSAKKNSLKELRMVLKKAGPNLSVLALQNKSRLCPVFLERKSKKEIEEDATAEDICPLIKKECEYKKNFDKHAFEIPERFFWDIDGLMEFAARHGLCPHMLQKEAVKCADIIVCDYNYAFNLNIARNFFLDIKGKRILALINEAHCFPDRCLDLTRRVLSIKTVQNAISESSEFGAPEDVREFLCGIKRRIDGVYNSNTKKIMEERAHTPADVESVKVEIDPTAIVTEGDDPAIKRLSDVGKSIAKRKLDEKKGVVSSIWRVARILDGFLAYVGYENNLYYLDDCITPKRKERTYKIGRVLIDPFVLLEYPLKRFYKTVHYSASFYPGSYLKWTRLSEYGKTMMATDEFSPTFTRRNYRDLFYDGMSFTAERRANHGSMLNAAADIKDMVTRMPKPVGIFTVHPLWDAVTPHMKKYSFKTLVCKGYGQSDVDRFISEIAGNDIVVISMHSRFGESLDLPELKSQIIMGVPVEPLDLIKTKQIELMTKRFAQDRKAKDPRTAAFMFVAVIPAISRGIQARGRPLRFEKDMRLRIWYDKRWVNFRPWLHSMNEKICMDREDMIKAVEQHGMKTTV